MIQLRLLLATGFILCTVACGKGQQASAPVPAQNGTSSIPSKPPDSANGDSSDDGGSSNAGSSVKAPSLLIVGDSHSCGAFGAEMVMDLAKKGFSVTLYCAVSSTPANWMNGTTPAGQVCQTMTSAKPALTLCGGTGKVPKFATILAATDPTTLVVIAHGTNSLLSTSADANYKKMAQAVAARKNACVWVGPPHLRPDQAKGFSTSRLTTMEGHLAGFYSSLSDNVSSVCDLLDSRVFTAKGTLGYASVDGVHRTTAAGNFWADKIVLDLGL